jgi:ABC-type Zn uptake system ZnuABC Zn-binding protein ZnuA
MADKCVAFCYAKKGAYIWRNVKPAFEMRYQLSKTDKFIAKINAEITLKEPEYIRVHDSGDYYSKEYLNKWIEIAKANPDVKFYSYTNCIQMLKDAILPKNYDVIFSSSGKQVDLIDKTKDRHSVIFKTKSELLDNGYVDASKIDLFATKWFSRDNNKIGLIYH